MVLLLSVPRGVAGDRRGGAAGGAADAAAEAAADITATAAADIVAHGEPLRLVHYFLRGTHDGRLFLHSGIKPETSPPQPRRYFMPRDQRRRGRRASCSVGLGRDHERVTH